MDVIPDDFLAIDGRPASIAPSHVVAGVFPVSLGAGFFDLLQLTKLEEVFETYRDEKEALVSF